MAEQLLSKSKRKILLEMIRKRGIYVISIIHFLISCMVSRAFFVPLRENTGIENMAYNFPQTGATLKDDFLSRILCSLFSHVLAIIIIFVFWNWIRFLYRTWKKSVKDRKYIVVLLLCAAMGILMIAGLYPATVISSLDTSYNYVYAREWLPMYWHGFLTNVVHCACLLVFTHPIAMSVIPFLFGINVMFYFTCRTIMEFSPGFKKIKMLSWCIILLFMPETLRLLTYAGRNYMYAILSISVLGISLIDYLEKKTLGKRKFVVLSFLVICLATWRSEGIIYLLFYPFILYFTYFYKRKLPGKGQFIKGAVCLGVLYLALSLPGKYGNEKYQGYDYFIINTPGPLSVVLADENVNLDYKDADKDLKTINAVIPLEYIYKYGENATVFYNWDSGRLSRQCNAGSGGKEYVVASYRLLFHNWTNFFKYQINIYLKSIGIQPVFNLPEVKMEDWTPRKEVVEKAAWVMEYYTIGETDINVDHRIVFINDKINGWIRRIVSFISSGIYGWGWRCSGFVKIAATILTIAMSLIFLIKKEWIYVFWGAVIMGILAAVILAAPAARENYYYSVYFNQYWFLFFSAVQMKKDMNVAENVKMKGDSHA